MIFTSKLVTFHRRRSAFSLVEVTISLGIVSFALVGILGALPLAMSSGRYSFEQTRASNIANTLFASFRAQPFNKVYYLTGDGSSATPTGPYLDLTADTDSGGKSATTSPSTVQMYAQITDGMTTGEAVQFQKDAAKAEYSVILHTNKKPGVTATNPSGTMAADGLANQVEVVISALDHPKDVYTFVSVVANRAQ